MSTEHIYERPEDYDLEHDGHAEDARFYGHLLRRLHPTRILELACGSGRVTAALAVALPQAEIVGIDASQEMLDRASARLARSDGAVRQRVTLIQGDMRTWDGSGQPFDAVLLGGCSASHLTTLADRLVTWGNVGRWLKPGGAFLMDVQMPDLATLAESQRLAPRAVLQLDVDASRRRGPASRLLRCTATMYEPHLQQAEVRFLYDRWDGGDHADRFVSDFTQHVYFPAELELLFAASGFELVQQYGDYGFVPFGRTSPYLITLARRPAQA